MGVSRVYGSEEKYTIYNWAGHQLTETVQITSDMYPEEPADPTTEDVPTQSQKDNNIYDSNGTYIGICRVICTKTGTY